MLKKINEGRVESSDGYAVHITGMETLQYEERNKILELEWNYDPESGKTIIYASEATCWDKPFNIPISKENKNKILNNIKNAVELLTGRFEVV